MRHELIARYSQHVLLSLSVWIVFGVEASPQDAETVKATMMKSLAKIENYSAGIIKGTWGGFGAVQETGQLQFRGDKMWLESVGRNLNQPAEQYAAKIKASLEVMGTAGLLHTCEFDGKKFYEFNPYNLALRIESASRLPPAFSGLPLRPENWLYMGSDRTQFFRRFIEDSDYPVKVEELGGGRWKLSQSDLGSLLPEESRKHFLGVKDRYIIVDEQCEFLVTKYYGKGAKVEVEGTLEWDKQDGNWYAKHGKQFLAGKPIQEWTIEEISFDATKCRTKFNDLESTAPFATRIDTYDEKGQLISQSYQGGKDGEVEHKLRSLALRQRKKNGFK